MKVGFLILLSMSMVFYATLSSAQSYRLLQAVITSGGGRTSSAGYSSENALGQPAVGTTSSAGYQQGSGLLYLVGAGASNTFIYTVADAWNMLSVPRTVPDYRKSVLFPTAISPAFGFGPTGYVPADTLRNGSGYWLKFAGVQNITITGTPRRRDTINVAVGWTMIGSISRAVSTDSIIQIPPNIVASQYYGFQNGYVSAAFVEPGKAYWVKTRSSGQLIIEEDPYFPRVPSPLNTDPARLDNLNELLVTVKSEASGGPAWSQKLLLGRSSSTDENLDLFDLPPPPPAGAVDARFFTNRSVLIIPDAGQNPQEIPVRIQTKGHAVTIEWTMKHLDGIKYTFLEKSDGVVTTEQRMRGTGSLGISPAAEKTYAVKVERIPLSYQLYQNYPNPFNPATTIRFDLPEPARVTAKVFDILGREVVTLLNNQELEEGQQSITFDARNIATGVYFYRLLASHPVSGRTSFQNVRKMLLLK